MAVEYLRDFPKQKFLELIASGCTEPEALQTIGYADKRSIYVLLLTKNAEYREAIDSAKKTRADVWFNEIAASTRNKELGKEDVPIEKLRFEQRKYLAAIDNPDRYAEKSKHSLDLNLNIFQEMKDLPIAEAKKLLKAADPFAQAVEAEFESVSEDGGPVPYTGPRRKSAWKKELDRARKEDEMVEERGGYDTSGPMELDEDEEEEAVSDEEDIFS